MAIMDLTALSRLNDEIRNSDEAKKMFKTSIVPVTHYYNQRDASAETTVEQDCFFLMDETVPRLVRPLCDAYMIYKALPLDKQVNPGMWFTQQYTVSLIVSESGETFSKAPRGSTINWKDTRNIVIISQTEHTNRQNFVVLRNLGGRTDLVDIGLYTHVGDQCVTKGDYVLQKNTEIEAEFNINVAAFDADPLLASALIHFLEEGLSTDMMLCVN